MSCLLRKDAGQMSAVARGRGPVGKAGRAWRVALVGISGYGLIYYRLLREIMVEGRIRLVACVVILRDEQREIVAELEAAGCQIYEDFATMLARHGDELDLCCLPTPIAFHARMAVAALDAGTNVLVEKPLAASLAEVAEIRRAERRNPGFVAVGFQDLYAEENLVIKRQLLAGEIGRVLRIRVRGLWPRDSAYYGRNAWAGRIRCGDDWVLDSPIGNAFAHFVNLALFWAGPSFAKSATVTKVRAELFRAQAIENYDTAAMLMQTASGPVVAVYASHSSINEIQPELMVDGTQGTVHWRLHDRVVVHVHGATLRAIPLPDVLDSRRRMLERVLRKLDQPAEFICSTDIAREHTRCMVAVQTSGPIRQIDDAWRRLQFIKPNGVQRVHIEALDEYMAKAFHKGCLLRDVHCPWA